ncbi:MAG: alpha/beta hydrolase [Candidatus Kuenenbacteria bacterium]
MKKQIIVIHGGATFDTHEDYIFYLKNEEINLERLKSHKNWKDTLATELGSDYEILTPQMPNKTNARYKEWKLWFERIVKLLNNEIILIGHSLGGIFLVKYLSENSISKTIKATILVAAPFDNDAKSKKLLIKHSLTDFLLPSSLAKFIQQGNKIYLLHSKDDPDVLFGQLEKYKQALPNAKAIVFNNRGHFNQETFPEIVELIKSL